MSRSLSTQDPSETVVRAATIEDGEALARIYNHFVRETIVTFEEEAISPGEMGRRIEEVASLSLPWLVAERDAVVVGYAYAAPWRSRRAYRFSTEVTVYAAPDQAGRGFGSRLYSRLLPALRDREIHAAMGGIALPNDASVALHEKFGFRKVAHLEQVGFKFDRWIDVGYWQLIL
jgi:phosphinothricin acetyltransferase